MSTANILRHDFVSRGNELARRLDRLSITTIQTLAGGGITTIEQLLDVPEVMLRQHPFFFGQGELDNIQFALEECVKT